MYVGIVMATVMLVLIALSVLGWCTAIVQYTKRREAEEDYAKLYIQCKIYGDSVADYLDTEEEMEP